MYCNQFECTVRVQYNVDKQKFVQKFVRAHSLNLIEMHIEFKPKEKKEFLFSSNKSNKRTDKICIFVFFQCNVNSSTTHKEISIDQKSFD